MAQRSGNPFAEFDFGKMLDVSKLMADFRMPGVDVEAITASQRKNLEALTAANQLAIEGMQAVARRQTEILRQVMEEATSAMKDVMTAGSPEDKASRQTDIAKEALSRAVSNMRELAEMVAKSNNEAFDVINRRVSDSLDELKTLIGRRR